MISYTTTTVGGQPVRQCSQCGALILNEGAWAEHSLWHDDQTARILQLRSFVDALTFCSTCGVPVAVGQFSRHVMGHGRSRRERSAIRRLLITFLTQDRVNLDELNDILNLDVDAGPD